MTLTPFYRFLSIDLWGGLPAPWQRAISRLYTMMYNTAWSKHIIAPYCKHHYDDPQYLQKFVPASGEVSYRSFQDFFSRRLSTPLATAHRAIWPAEGLLCEYGLVGEMDMVKVKGEKRHLRTIFGAGGDLIPDGHHYSNIFLHNNNYHRIHAPVSGKITRIERIKGDLVLLRPWVYKRDPSLPALRNERVNIDIRDEQGNTWFLSIVGGPAVGTVVLPDNIEVDASVTIGQELSVFLLGSTCCMAAPVPSVKAEVGNQVFVGLSLD